MINPAPGHVWWMFTSTHQLHQFLIEVMPDKEGVLVAKCGQPIHNTRVDRTVHEGEPCVDCLLGDGLAGLLSSVGPLADRLDAQRAQAGTNFRDVPVTPEEFDERERRDGGS